MVIRSERPALDEEQIAQAVALYADGLRLERNRIPVRRGAGYVRTRSAGSRGAVAIVGLSQFAVGMSLLLLTGVCALQKAKTIDHSEPAMPLVSR